MRVWHSPGRGTKPDMYCLVIMSGVVPLPDLQYVMTKYQLEMVLDRVVANVQTDGYGLSNI